MTAALTCPARVPFDYWFFYNAMIGLIGREPNHEADQDVNGFHEYIYQPTDDAEREKLKGSVRQLWEWLDKFDITFSRSHCDFSGSDKTWGEVLRITIRHPVTKDSVG